MASSFLSGLKKFGQEALKIISFGAIGAEAAAPFVTAFNPAIGTLLSGSAQIILAAETAGAAAVANAPSASTAAQKAALAVVGIEPLAQQFCKQLGFSAPTAEQVQKFSDALVGALNVFGVAQTAVAAEGPGGNPPPPTP